MKLKIILLATSLTTIVCQASDKYGALQELQVKIVAELKLREAFLEEAIKALDEKEALMGEVKKIKALAEELLIEAEQKLQVIFTEEGKFKRQLTLEEGEAFKSEIKKLQDSAKEHFIEAKQKSQAAKEAEKAAKEAGKRFQDLIDAKQKLQAVKEEATIKAE